MGNGRWVRIKEGFLLTITYPDGSKRVSLRH